MRKFIVLGSLFFFLSYGSAYAYPLNGDNGTGITSQSFNSSSFNFGDTLDRLSSPFQDFFQSMNGIHDTVVGIEPGLGSGQLNYETHGAMTSFDSWVYENAGFHPADLLVATLSVLSWTLGTVKGGVDWLLGIFK